jgi:hypothetical protein
MKYAVEMGSGAMIYIPSFIKYGSAIHKLIGGTTQIHRHTWRSHKHTFIFLNEKSRLKYNSSFYGGEYFGAPERIRESKGWKRVGREES